MLAAVVSFFAALIPAAIKAWFAGRKAPIVRAAEDAGASRQAAADAQARADVEQKVVQAQAEAPTTKDELVKELEDGSF